jgi:transposase
MTGLSHDKLVYVDQSGIEATITKDKGWSKSGKYYKRTNILAGSGTKKCIAPFVFHGSCNTELFNKWIEEFLLKELTPGQVVIMDKASFHRSPKTKELIASVGCTLIYLPPYSPDLNPIKVLGHHEAVDPRENRNVCRLI